MKMHARCHTIAYGDEAGLVFTGLGLMDGHCGNDFPPYGRVPVHLTECPVLVKFANPTPGGWESSRFSVGLLAQCTVVPLKLPFRGGSWLAFHPSRKEFGALLLSPAVSQGLRHCRAHSRLRNAQNPHLYDGTLTALP